MTIWIVKVWNCLDNDTLIDMLVLKLRFEDYNILLSFITLSRNLEFDKLPITRKLFESLALWAYKLEVWNDYHALRVGFKTWKNGIRILGYDIVGKLF